MKNSEIIFCSHIKRANHFWNGGNSGKSHHDSDTASQGNVSKKVMKKPEAYSENSAKNEDRTSKDHPAGKELDTGHLWLRTVTGSGNGPQAEPDVQGGFKS